MPTCLVVQHVAPESTWAIGDALLEAGVTLDVRCTFAGDALPASMAGHYGLVVMGGPMSATSDDGFATRRPELALLADALDAGAPTLGVCLGAQLLALAAGADVYPGDRGPEIGWGPVALPPGRHADPLLSGLPEQLSVLHWHAETFDLPAGARRLGSTDRYDNQAFRLGPAAWGVQFHLEATVAAVEGFLAAFPTDAEQLPGGAAAIRQETPGRVADLHPWSSLALGRFASLVANAPRRERTP